MTEETLFVLSAVLGLTAAPTPDTPEPPPTVEPVALVRAKDEGDTPAADVEKGSEIDAEPPKRHRHRGPISAVARCVGEALHKAVILLLAVAILALFKFCACQCGLPLH